MERQRITLRSDYSRRIPDPVLGGYRHFMWVRAVDVPEGISLGPNPRDQNTNRSVYREVLRSLLNHEGTPDTFHLKNKGITLIASSVRESKTGKGSYSVTLDPGQGIVDGGHTYRIILEGQETGDLSDGQYVKFEILVDVPEDLTTEIAGGLNTAVQVQEMSLANLSDRFEWIKEALRGEPYESVIAYKENEPDKELDVRDIVAYMTLFNVEMYPNTIGSADRGGGPRYPITAYRAKSTALSQFLDESNYEGFKKLSSILPDILVMADTIRHGAMVLHNRAGGKAGKLAFVDSRHRGNYTFPFIRREGPYRLSSGALFPMLGAFRWMVEADSDGLFRWRGGFREVLSLWEAIGGELMRLTQNASEENGRNPNAIGKSLSHWTTLHSVVAMAQMTGVSTAARR